MKKCITRSISLVLTLLMMITFAPLTFITKNANAAPSNQTVNIAAGSKTLYWGGFNKTNMPSLSKDNSSMITSWSFNGNDTFTINISENTSVNSRTGHIYAKQNGKTIATFTVYQAGKTHDHYYGDWTITKQPTCTKSGSKYRCCKKCGAYDYKTIPPTGHTTGSSQIVRKPTCTKEGLRAVYCTKCGTMVSSSTIKKVPHAYSSFKFNKSTEKVEGTCTMCGLLDSDVTYKEYLTNNNVSDNTTNRKNYLGIIYNKNNLPKGVTVDQLVESQSKSGSRSKILQKCSTVLGFTANAFTIASESNYSSNLDVYSKLSGIKDAKNLVTTCKWIGYASTITSLLGRIDGKFTPGDCVAIISSVASLGDSFGIFTSALSGMPDLIDRTAKAANAHYNTLYFDAAMDYSLTINGTTKMLSDVTLYEIYQYPDKIKDACYNINLSKKAANNMYEFLRDSKTSYIGYIINNPSYSGSYVSYCQSYIANK